jgi:hypothetical protein
MKAGIRGSGTGDLRTRDSCFRDFGWRPDSPHREREKKGRKNDDKGNECNEEDHELGSPRFGLYP